MSNISSVLLFMVSCVFTQNVVFSRLLGSDEAAQRRGVGAAFALGLATAAVMALAALCDCLAYRWVLEPLHAGYMNLVALALISAALACAAAAVVGRARPALREQLGDSLPMIAANCAVLGVALQSFTSGLGALEAALAGLFGGLGFTLALVLMAGVQERIAYSKVPKALKGLPISLISASLVALAFMGFMGIG